MDDALWREQLAFPSACRLLAPLLHVPWPISHGHARWSLAKSGLYHALASKPALFTACLQAADLISRRGAVFHALPHPNRPHAPVGGLQDRLIGLALGAILRRIGALARLVDALGLNAAGGKPKGSGHHRQSQTVLHQFSHALHRRSPLWSCNRTGSRL